MTNRESERITLSLVVALLVVFVQSLQGAGGASGGAGGLWSAGCGACHGPAASGDTSVTLSGPPRAGGTVTVTITSPVSGTGLNRGGFDLKAMAGKLFANLAVQVISEKEATHTALGNDQRSWSLEWQPPPTPLCDYDFSVAGLAANGDGVASSLDHWNIQSRSLVDDGVGDTSPPSATLISPAPSTMYINDNEIDAPATVVVGAIILRATATDNRGIERVEFLDSDLLGTTSLGVGSYDQTANQFSLAWNAVTETPGPHTLIARAVDCGGNVADAMMSIYIL